MTWDAKSLLSYLPFAIFALVMFWRYRTLHKARPLRLSLLWVRPVLFTIIVALVIVAMPPGFHGWLAMMGGVLIGSGLGWQRGRMMRLHVEGEGHDARVMIRQSPLALLVILAIFFARHLLLPRYEGGSGQVGHSPAGAMLALDAMLGMMLGMVIVMGIVLWLRARTLALPHRAGV